MNGCKVFVKRTNAIANGNPQKPEGESASSALHCCPCSRIAAAMALSVLGRHLRLFFVAETVQVIQIEPRILNKRDGLTHEMHRTVADYFAQTSRL